MKNNAVLSQFAKEEIFLCNGFTSFPNIILKYADVLDFDCYDIGIIIILLYMKEICINDGSLNESCKSLFNDAIKKAKKKS